MDEARFADDHVSAIAARTGAVVIVITLAVASLCPSSWLPRLLYSNNLEHFAGFYVLALAFAAARYRTRLTFVTRDVALLATLLEAARWILPGPRKGDLDHWMADLGGILAASAPLVVAAFRQRFVRPQDL